MHFDFIVNIHGGSGTALKTWKTVKKYLVDNKLDYKYYLSEHAGHGVELAKKIYDSVAAGEYINLVIVGGDGTINEVLNGIPDFTRVRLGLIPTGSGNDFARGLGIPRNTKKAIKLIFEGHTSYIDIGCSHYIDNGENKKRYFGISSGIGMDAIVCKRALTSKLKAFLNTLHLGKFTYIALTVHTLFSMKTERVSVKFDDETLELNNLIFLAAMNCRSEGGGVPMSPNAVFNDGYISVCIAYGIPKWKAFLEFPLLVLGCAEKLSGFKHINCKSIEMQLENAVVLHTDGEYCGDVKDIRMECLHNALQVFKN